MDGGLGSTVLKQAAQQRWDLMFDCLDQCVTSWSLYVSVRRYRHAHGGRTDPPKRLQPKLYKWCMFQRFARRNEVAIASGGTKLAASNQRISDENIAVRRLSADP